MASPSRTGRRSFGETLRLDAWWLQPLLVVIGFTAFIVYSTWAAYQGDHYTFGPYLSPMYSPELFGNSHHAWFGGQPSWWPSWLRFSPAVFILWAPGGLRITCYYYRGAYYKAFWADPPSCAVGEPRTEYRGEHKLPLLIQNIHRYFLYPALLLIVILSWDAWKAMWFTDPATGATGFGIGVGTIVLAVNVVLLAGFTFGCHALRHLVGGFVDQFSRHKVQHDCWRCVSWFNARHMLWAWLSLFWVAGTDLYVRLCSMGVISDWRIL